MILKNSVCNCWKHTGFTVAATLGRHQQMAHDVCRHGERLVCLSSKLSVPRLLRHLEEAHDRHGFAEHVLSDPSVWQDECGRQAVQRAVRAGWDSVADALVHVRLYESVL